MREGGVGEEKGKGREERGHSLIFTWIDATDPCYLVEIIYTRTSFNKNNVGLGLLLTLKEKAVVID